MYFVYRSPNGSGLWVLELLDDPGFRMHFQTMYRAMLIGDKMRPMGVIDPR
jgi:hypothetical protein